MFSVQIYIALSKDQRFDDIHIEKVARQFDKECYRLSARMVSWVLYSRKLYQQYLACTLSDSNTWGQCQ